MKKNIFVLAGQKMKYFKGKISFLANACILIVALNFLAIKASFSGERLSSIRQSELTCGLILSPELKGYKEFVYSPMISYPDFVVGEALYESLRQSISALYAKTEEIEGEPSSGKYDLILRFDLNGHASEQKSFSLLNSRLLPREENVEASLIRGVIAFTVDILDGRTMKLIKRKEIVGRAHYTYRWLPTEVGPSGHGLEFNATKFKKAMEKAIDEAVKKTIEVLHSISIN
jgi:hypothetical protein